MNRKSLLILLIIIIFASIQSCCATSVFLTSDHIGTESNDNEMLSEVKQYIQQLDPSVDVIIDPQAPSPGEGSRAVEADYDVVVNFAAVDCGNFQVLAHGSAKSDKQVIFVNTGNLNLDNKSFIKRAWDDNYSPTSFAAIASPSRFLNDAGINYIQPLQQFPDAGVDGVYQQSDNEVNKYIAEQIVDDIKNYNPNNEKTYDENLILKHQLNPSQMAQASSEYLNSNQSDNTTYNGYTTAQLLYLTSSYLNGTPLTTPDDYEEPDNPSETSYLTQDTYSYYDYVQMATITQEYMNENHKAPDSIDYKGAHIGYYDLQYNFAKITQNHTNNKNMDFMREYKFTKTHDNILTSLLPIAVVGIIILTALYLLRRYLINKKRKQQQRRRRGF
ncbi:adhesin [uncultured Methanosphaera sp.]|uniref:adhesin n=1 Tax=uncultured Methanosphaera sp. TaxID=262501 RepID=UPI002804B650|nr:adhesin [uncultured Methanosphaera sp.]